MCRLDHTVANEYDELETKRFYQFYSMANSSQNSDTIPNHQWEGTNQS